MLSMQFSQHFGFKVLTVVIHFLVGLLFNHEDRGNVFALKLQWASTKLHGLQPRLYSSLFIKPFQQAL
jgi:hypothetical protein